MQDIYAIQLELCKSSSATGSGFRLVLIVCEWASIQSSILISDLQAYSLSFDPDTRPAMMEIKPFLKQFIITTLYCPKWD